MAVNFECGSIDISKLYQCANEKPQTIGKINIINSFCADSQNPNCKVVIWKVNSPLFIGQDFALKSKFKGTQGMHRVTTQVYQNISVLFIHSYYAFFILMNNLACDYLKLKTST